ncbi:MAG: ABC transporter permease [Acidimicrobiia bacterium]|nr:ABC transporter permease [Acidimicrobiia bacterium]
MSTLRQMSLIAYRDFIQRARSRAFLISMLVIVAMVAAVGLLLASEAGEPDPYTIGTVGAVPDGFGPGIEDAAAAFDREAELEGFDDLGSAEESLKKGDVDVLVVDGRELVWNDEVSSQLGAIVEIVLQGIGRRQTIAELGLTTEEAGRLLAPAPTDSRTLTEPDPQAVPREVAAFAGSAILYISILMFGQFVLMGVMEEKSSRVVEVVLSRVKPYQLLAGKIVGIGVLGLIQLLVLGAAAVGSLTFFDVADVDLSGFGLRVVGGVLLWYLLGYGFYSVIYGSLGATVSRQEDAQGVVMVPVLLLLPGYFISLLMLDDPDSLLARITSIIPPTSPLVMPVRAAVTDVPAWEMALAIALVIASTYGLIRLGGRIYQGSILRLGAKVKVRDAWRSSES